ncbi:hypothetical protein, unlikely [Trypanosoma brucei gambiense DAL972]|uniref:Uncharacterized protein n=1 Tax=Trypanosoma brucei gambiense (strain MHOM/CI/86/DAL972) TaxID=679716 RepID=D0A3S9_TRYB9|nr:hypothetical protein, unlikely [Trypanosoma brucei gambiense DAL972]CBH15923.1 hypothetical protein, unlikely [Trypanosoma brucei gambiense DAL972]|eukprot:XP_011778187.1 hypothetical protein, unlikely [Trypanosoma brucei gambiense DAL972]
MKFVCVCVWGGGGWTNAFQNLESGLVPSRVFEVLGRNNITFTGDEREAKDRGPASISAHAVSCCPFFAVFLSKIVATGWCVKCRSAHERVFVGRQKTSLDT